MYFGAAGIDKIVKAMDGLVYTDKDYFDVKTKFIHELGYIDDSCCVQHNVDVLNSIYERTADTSYFQNEVLMALARLKTFQSWASLRKLLAQDPPVFDNSEDYASLFAFFDDSLTLAKTLLPDLLQLSSIQDYKQPVTNLLRALVDSGLLQAKDYEQYYTKLYFDGLIQLKKQQNLDEKSLEKESNEDEDDENRRSGQYSFNYRDMARLGRYHGSAFKTGTDGGIGLSDYAVLLCLFYDTYPSVPKFFERQLQSKDPAVQLDAAVILIKNNKKVDDSILLNIASKSQYRARLLKRLSMINHAELFPLKYKNQDSLARSVLLNDKGYSKYSDMACLGKQLVTVNSQKGYVFFYKYKIKKDDDWHLGLSGIQPENTDEVSADDLLTKMTEKKIKADLLLAEQLNDQLKRLLLQQHRSAQSFFEDENDYNYLRKRYAGFN